MKTHLQIMFDHATDKRKEILWNEILREEEWNPQVFNIGYELGYVPEHGTWRCLLLSQKLNKFLEIHAHQLTESFWENMLQHMSSSIQQEPSILGIDTLITLARYAPDTTKIRTILIQCVDECTSKKINYKDGYRNTFELDIQGLSRLLLGDENDKKILLGVALQYLPYSGHQQHQIGTRLNVLKKIYDTEILENTNNMPYTGSTLIEAIAPFIKNDDVLTTYLREWIYLAHRSENTIVKDRIYADIDQFVEHTKKVPYLKKWKTFIDTIKHGPVLHQNYHTPSTINVEKWLHFTTPKMRDAYITNLSDDDTIALALKLARVSEHNESIKNDIVVLEEQIVHKLSKSSTLNKLPIDVGLLCPYIAKFIRDDAHYKERLLYTIANIEYLNTQQESKRLTKLKSNDSSYAAYQTMQYKYGNHALYVILTEMYPEHNTIWNATANEELLSTALTLLMPNTQNIKDAIPVAWDMGLLTLDKSIQENVDALLESISSSSIKIEQELDACFD